MGIALQIRDVPEPIRDALAAAAAERGQSLQAYLLDLVSREARARGNLDLFRSELRVDLGDFDPVAVIREGRDAGFEADRRS